MYIWVVGTSNNSFGEVNILGRKMKMKKDIYIYIKLVAGKTSLYLIDSFCTPHSLGFNRSFWLGSFVPICCYPFPTDNHFGNFGMQYTARNKEI